jgi:hypothetical protein
MKGLSFGVPCHRLDEEKRRTRLYPQDLRYPCLSMDGLKRSPAAMHGNSGPCLESVVERPVLVRQRQSGIRELDRQVISHV